MGSYSNRGHMIHEAASGASVSHFSWFYPGGLFAAPKTTSSSPPQGTRFNPEPILPATPIRSVGPKTETSKSKKKGSTPAKAGKQKPCNQVPSKSLKVKQPKKSPSKKIKGKSIPDAKREKNLNIDIDKANFDLSGMPSPFCSCTGMPRVCYRWGAGGWQSSCCTINVSEYPLPMSPKRPGARMAGRKMSNGAYIKLLWKLAAEGHDLSHPVDLKEHWARHGTNKFVTIK